MEKLYKVLEIELKMYTSVGPKFIFEKVKFKVLHYIQYDFICQRQGLSKDQTSMLCYELVTLIADCEIPLRTHPNVYTKGNRYFCFIKG